MAERNSKMTKYNTISNDRRCRIINSFQNNMPIKEICTYESLPKSTVYSIVNNFKKSNSFVKLKQGGKKYEKITSEIQDFIQKQVDENCTISIKNLQKMVLLKFDVSVCEATIYNKLKDLHYSLKMLKCVPEKRNDVNTLEIRKQYAIDFENITDNYPDTNIFFIDEVGFNVSMRINKGWSKIGETPIAKVKNVKSKNISVCCAYSRSGISFHEINVQAYNTVSFTGYISNLFEHFTSLNIGPCVVIMDNVPFHKSTLVKHKFIEKGHVIKYLPPYSPMLNPIENAFSKWKTYVKRANCMSEEELLRAMADGMKTINKDDCEGWYTNMKRYLRLSKEGVAIL